MYHFIVFFFILGMGIAFLDKPSHWDDNKPTYDSYIKQQERITARRVAELDKKKELDMVIPQHSTGQNVWMTDSRGMYQLKNSWMACGASFNKTSILL